MSKVSKIQQRVNQPSHERSPVVNATPKGVETAIPEVRHTTAPNTFWDEAQAVYRKSIMAIQDTHGQLAAYLETLVADTALFAKIADGKTLLSNIQLLSVDIEAHVQRLNAIHEKHKDRFGGTQTPDDNMLVIQIHGQYADAIEVYESTIMPTVGHIFEQIGAAEELLALEKANAEAAQQQQLADPTVVSDVAVKETTSA